MERGGEIRGPLVGGAEQLVQSPREGSLQGQHRAGHPFLEQGEGDVAGPCA